MMNIMELGPNDNYYLSNYRLPFSQSSHVSFHTHTTSKEAFILFFGVYA